MISLCKFYLKRGASCCLVAALLLFLGGCFSQSQKVIHDPVLTVNAHSLSVKEFSRLIAHQLKDLDALAAKDPNNVVRAKETILAQFIIGSLIQDYAKEKSIEVPQSLLDKEIANYRSHYPDDLSFRKMLAEEGLSLSEWRTSLRDRILERLVFEDLNKESPAPTLEELKAFYETQKESFKRKDQIYLRQIVVEDESKVDVLKKELKTKDFAVLAKRFSITPEAKEGGLVGWIEKGTVDYFDPLFKLREGAISEVFQSPFGFHIARVERKQAARTLPFESVQGQLAQQMRAQKEQAIFKSWLDQQMRKSKILRNNELIQALIIDTKEK
jgi:peptidyl-prolyl cis-trans isomerase C